MISDTKQRPVWLCQSSLALTCWLTLLSSSLTCISQLLGTSTAQLATTLLRQLQNLAFSLFIFTPLTWNTSLFWLIPVLQSRHHSLLQDVNPPSALCALTALHLCWHRHIHTSAEIIQMSTTYLASILLAWYPFQHLTHRRHLCKCTAPVLSQQTR